ncbi:MAG: hypothetical protein Q8P25_04660 [Candidatus Curtissbacteria bacterium]|nr:hypothetical protein [Candidatus Curtissbacteria bacterium]
MSNVKKLQPSFKLHPNLLNIKASSSFTKTYRKINGSKNIDFIFVQKPKSEQMFAVILSRLMGKKFMWIQNFENPPVANFLGKLLLAQADKVIVSSKGDFNKLKGFGVQKSKIHYQQ